MRLGGHIFLLIIVVVSIVSCRSAKQIAVKKNIPSITEGRLLKNIENNELEYSTLFAKKMDISYKDGKGSNSLKASLKIKRDSFIQANVTAPLGSAILRGSTWYTPCSAIRFRWRWHWCSRMRPWATISRNGSSQ